MGVIVKGTGRQLQKGAVLIGVDKRLDDYVRDNVYTHTRSVFIESTTQSVRATILTILYDDLYDAIRGEIADPLFTQADQTHNDHPRSRLNGTSM